MTFKTPVKSRLSASLQGGFLPRSTTFRRTWLGVVGAGALSVVCLPPSTAKAQALPYSFYNPSLQSENTYFLFREGFDSLQDPSRLAMLDRSSLYTLLANQAGGQYYSLGLSTPVGPGSLGLFASTTGSGSFDETITEEVDESSGVVQSRQTLTSYAEARSANLYAGYGLPMGNLQLGMGLRLSLGRIRQSADDNGTSGPNSLYEDLEDQTTSSTVGEISSQSDAYQLIFSASSGDLDALHVQGDLMVTANIARSVVDVTVDDVDFESTLSGVSPATVTDPWGNTNMVVVGAELNPTYRISRELAVEAFVGAELGIPSKTAGTLTSFSRYTGGAFDSESTLTYTLTPNALGYNALSLFGSGHFDVAPGVELRLGLGYTRNHSESDSNFLAESVTVLGDSDPITASTEDNTRTAYTWSSFLAPVALRLKVGEKLTLRAGGRFVLSSYDSEYFTKEVANVVEGESQPIDETQELETNAAWSPGTTFSLGMDFQPSQRVNLELMLSNGYGGRVPYTYSGIILVGAATLHW